MHKLIDKLLLFGLCLLVLSFTDVQWISVIVMLVAMAASALSSYYEQRVPVLFAMLYVILCITIPEFTLFLPLLVYDLAAKERGVLRFSWCAAMPSSVIANGWHVATVVALGSVTAFLLQHRTSANLAIQNRFYALTDDAKEKAAFLESRNRELMKKQDYEVRLATLAERNRIARERHDNVGHLLTRAILQVSAMLAANAGDNAREGAHPDRPGIKPPGTYYSEAEGTPTVPSGNSTADTASALSDAAYNKITYDLHLIKNTLSDAMDSIRSSVHDLHDDSIDLKLQLESIINSFTFCPVKLRYDAGELPFEIRVCFAAVVRESLSNIARHSKATEASINITEHPAFCQLVIWDNGPSKMQKSEKGIGLQNMADRVNTLGGVFRTEDDKGFKVFVSVPISR